LKYLIKINKNYFIR